MGDVLSHKEAEDRLKPLVGLSCSIARRSYGGEVVLGFGSTELPDWPLRQSQTAEWMLYTGVSAWRIDANRELVSSKKGRRRSKRSPTEPLELVQGLEVLKARVAKDGGLTISLSEGVSVFVDPTLGAKPSEVTWQFFLPSARVLVRTGEKFLLSSRDILFGTMNEPSDSPSPGPRARARRRLREVAWSLNWILLEPFAMERDSQVDAVLVAPDNTLIAVDIKSEASSEGGKQAWMYFLRFQGAVTDDPRKQVFEPGVISHLVVSPEEPGGAIAARLKDLVTPLGGD